MDLTMPPLPPPPLRLRPSNEHLPGWTTEERPVPQGHRREESRRAVFDPDNVYVGEIVYVRVRHRGGGSTYGWRPANTPSAQLLTGQVDAIRRLSVRP